MGRYVMTNRCAGKSNDGERRASRLALDGALAMLSHDKARVIGDSNPADPLKRRWIILESEVDIVDFARRKCTPDVILEPKIHHSPLSHDRHYSELGLRFGGGARFTVNITGKRKPLVGCLVYMDLVGPGDMRATVSAVTGDNGAAVFNFPPIFTPAKLLALPHGGFWDSLREGVEDGMTVDVPALPDGPLGWWHKSVGFHDCDLTNGAGIKVGIVDSGVGPHRFLSHVESVGSFIDLHFNAHGGTDVSGHGSHVCGIIGAHPDNRLKFTGIAVGSELFSARVLPHDKPASQDDISAAIEFLVESHEVDLINLSVGSKQYSEALADAIRLALENGTLCLCAAGNDGGSVNCPAALEEAVAVAAMGLEGCAPEGTTASACTPPESEKFGTAGRFLANFSCHGPEIDCCAPGVGIISTVPERYGLEAPYAAMDGTSMASPVACAVLATQLARAPQYRGLARDSNRSSMARQMLKMSCRDIGMDQSFQGSGIPTKGDAPGAHGWLGRVKLNAC